jgi:hypothetical protein
MDFTPPSCSLGIDRSQPEQIMDLVRVAFAFPGGTVTMMVQPHVDGRKAVKFVEPLVQGNSLFHFFLFFVVHGNYC